MRGYDIMKKHKVLALVMLSGLLTIGAPALSVSAKWKSTAAGKNTMYTQKASPGYVTGWKTIKKYTYYFNSKGILQKGFQKIKKKLYYFESHGRLVTGWFTTPDGKKYYANKNGVVATKKWVGKYYLQADGSMAVNTWVNGKWVGPDGKFTGVYNNGWVKKGSKTYYYDLNLQPVKGWLILSGKKYYLNPSTGVLMKGWITVGGRKYYAHSSTGAILTSQWKSGKYLTEDGSMAVGVTKIGKYTYYFTSDGTQKKSCWLKINKKYYYFNNKGVMLKKKWVTNKSKTKKYYVTADGTRALGWINIGKNTYYFNPKNGLMQSGWITVDGQRYYLNSKGRLQKGRWLWSGKYYATTTGAVLKGLNAVGSSIYYFDTTTGKKLTSSLKKIGTDSYYFQSDGTAAINKWITIGSKYYYFQSNGKMAKNTWVGQYFVDANGVRTNQVRKTGWNTFNGVKYYFDSNGTMLTGWQTINGSTYYFNTNGAMFSGIQMIGSQKYCFYSDGRLVTSTTIVFGTKQYTVNANGVVTKEESIKVSGSTKGVQIVNYALQFVGNRYVYGGNSLTDGVDCSGFVQQVFKYFGISTPRVADDQMKYKYATVVDISSIQPGDLLFYGSANYASHVAIYMGDGKIVHASNSQPYPQGGIKVSNYNYQTPIRAVRYWS